MGRPGWYYDGHPPACTCVACNEGGGRSRSTATATSDGGSGRPPRATASYEENGDGGGMWKGIFIAIIAFVVIAAIGGAMDEDDTSPESTTTLVSATMAVHRQAATVDKSVTAASEKRIELPNLRHLNEKQYMLELINAERKKAGLNPVVLGDNIAAQLHAESALQNCFSSHWGIDGLKPYMRYSLAGSYQSNAENGSGSDYCIKSGDRYRAIVNINRKIDDAIEGWMDSPGHRRNMLDKHHKKVNIGMAWDRYNFLAYQHFEGDYVEYGELPSISTEGTLSLSGTTKNGVSFGSNRDLGVQIYYDQPPHELTRGQVSRTYCVSGGRQVAALREPLTGNRYWPEDKFAKTYKPCPDPYDVPADAPPANSHDEAHALWQEAYDASKNRKEQTIIVPWITASEWSVSRNAFSVTADIEELLGKHRDGVYTIVVWGDIDGEDVVISEYSIFHGVTPPDTYTPTSTHANTRIPTSTATATPNPTHTPTRTVTPNIIIPIPNTPTPSPTTIPSPKPTNTPILAPSATPITTLPVCGHVELVLMGASKQHKPCYTPTPILAPGNERAEVPTQTVVPTSTATPIPTNTSTQALETPSQPQTDITELESLVHRLMNDERAKRGMKLLQHDGDIHQFTRMQIENMAKGEPITGYECVKNDRIHQTSSISITSIAPISSVIYRNGELVYVQMTEEEIAADIVSNWVENDRNENSYARVGVGIGVTADGQGMTIILNFC